MRAREVERVRRRRASVDDVSEDAVDSVSDRAVPDESEDEGSSSGGGALVVDLREARAVACSSRRSVFFVFLRSRLTSTFATGVGTASMAATAIAFIRRMTAAITASEKNKRLATESTKALRVHERSTALLTASRKTTESAIFFTTCLTFVG